MAGGAGDPDEAQLEAAGVRLTRHLKRLVDLWLKFDIRKLFCDSSSIIKVWTMVSKVVGSNPTRSGLHCS